MFQVNVCKTRKRLHLHINAGRPGSNNCHWRDRGIPFQDLHQNGIANILSLDKVADTPGFNISHSTQSGIQHFWVETPNGSMMKNLIHNRLGLYYLNCEQHFKPGTTGCVFGQNIINTEQRLITWKQQGGSFIICYWNGWWEQSQIQLTEYQN